MKRAISLGEIAYRLHEIPVGCVIVKDGKIIAEANNQTEHEKSALHHAEIIAIEKASKALNSPNLTGCELYVTLEPCPMCAGAIINSKVSKVVFGAFDRNYGACGTAMNLFSADNIHKPECYGGIMEDECTKLLKDFFNDLRGKS